MEGGKEMRNSCLQCVMKHLAQAIILLTESKLGYSINKWLAIGHLAEAEAESVKDFLELAIKIRDIRLKIEINDYDIDLIQIIKEAERFEKNDK